MRLARFGLGLIGAAALAAPLVFEAAPAQAQNEQFIPVLIYRTGPYAAGGTGIFGGAMDYWAMINERDGGVNGGICHQKLNHIGVPGDEIYACTSHIFFLEYILLLNYFQFLFVIKYLYSI